MTDTQYKLNEASFFLERMKEANRDKNGFRYNLSAFLSAFCSFPEIMNIEFQKISGFISWNKAMRSNYYSSKLIQFFEKQRNRSIHLRPVSARPNQNLEGICLREITVGKDGDQEDWLQKTKELSSTILPSSWGWIGGDQS